VLHGAAFWQKHVYWNVWQRAMQAGAIAPTHVHGPLYYVTFIAGQLRHIWPLGILALWLAIDRLAARKAGAAAANGMPHREALLTLAIAAAVPVLAFSAARNKAWWYVLPAMPPLCLLGGIALENAVLALRPRMLRLPALALVLILLGFGAARNTEFTIRRQVRHGLRGYGAVAEIARSVERFAAKLGLRNPVVFVPAESPTVAVYVPFRVVVDPLYAERLSGGDAAVPGCDGVMVLDRSKAIEALGARMPLSILKERSGYVLALAGGPPDATRNNARH